MLESSYNKLGTRAGFVEYEMHCRIYKGHRIASTNVHQHRQQKIPQQTPAHPHSAARYSPFLLLHLPL